METVTLPPPLADYSPTWKELSSRVANVPGDIAEFGVYNGGGARALAKIFPDRNVWAFDTYMGIPGKDFLRNIDQDSPGSFVPTYSMEQMFGEYPNIIPVKGMFCDTLPMLPMRPKIAFCYLDCDLYNSAMDVFWWLPSHLSDGALIFLDDYVTHRSIRKATDAFVSNNRYAKFDPKYIEETEVGDIRLVIEWSRGD